LAEVRSSACIVALLLAGCGRWGFDEARTGSALDAAVDAADPPEGCDPMAPFGVPVAIPELSDPTVADGTLRLAPDELTGYFWSRRTTAGVSSRIFFVARPDVASPFTAQEVTGLNTTGNVLDPTMPTTGAKVLVFRHNTPGDDVWIATAVTDTDFTGAAPIASLNSTSTDAQPFVRPGSDELVYQSKRTGNGDLYRATRTGDITFSAPMLIAELATTSEESDPMLSTDGLALYFRSDAPAGALAGHNIYVSTRPDTAAPWGTPVLVPNVNTALDDGPSALSADGCRLYISSDRLGTNDVFVAMRGT
jgi:hypothetical protein